MNIIKRICRKLRKKKEYIPPTTAAPVVTATPVVTDTPVVTTTPVVTDAPVVTAAPVIVETPTFSIPYTYVPTTVVTVTPEVTITQPVLLPELPGFFRSFSFSETTPQGATFNNKIKYSIKDAYRYLMYNWNVLGTEFREQCNESGYREDCSRVINHFSNAGNYYNI